MDLFISIHLQLFVYDLLFDIPSPLHVSTQLWLRVTFSMISQMELTTNSFVALTYTLISVTSIYTSLLLFVSPLSGAESPAQIVDS